MDASNVQDSGPSSARSMLVLTGANFSGKSVYLKQVAVIVILAQVGSYVPAERAKIGIHDAIYTRVTTTESSARNSSAFMIDLQQVSFMYVEFYQKAFGSSVRDWTRLNSWLLLMTTVNLQYLFSRMPPRLRNCTRRSLLLLDEFGKGTDPIGTPSSMIWTGNHSLHHWPCVGATFQTGKPCFAV